MKIRTIFPIFASLVLVFSLLVPGVMAHEREVSDSQTADLLLSKEIPKLGNGEAVSAGNQKEIETLVNLLLKDADVAVENLDLSRMKTAESEERYETGGMISFDIVDGNQRKTYTAEMYTLFNFAESSTYVVATTGTNYYEMEMRLTDDADNYIVSQKSVLNGKYQTDAQLIPRSKAITETGILGDPIAGTKNSKDLILRKYDLPTNPPMLSYQVYNDAQLSDLLSVTSLVLIIAGSISGVGGAATLVSAAIELFNLFGSSITGVETYNIYVDIFACPPSPLPYYSLPAYGVRGCNGVVYMEVDYYYK